MEQLFDIKGFVNYRVTRSGKIFSLTNNLFLKPYLQEGKYYRVGLMKDGICFKRSIHRIVCQAFHPNPFNKPEVNHLDGNKLNNNDWNVEWSTRNENMKHAVVNNLCVGIKGGNHYMAKMVIDIVTGEKFDTMSEAAKKVKYDVSHFRKMLSGKQKNKTNFKIII